MLTLPLPVAIHSWSRLMLLSCVSAILLLPLAGCSLFKTPFAISAEPIDDKSPQSTARIRLSPPQVFTREQLINDRLREDGFLVGQLAKSESATLGTSLARDLQTIAALAIPLSLNFDQAAMLNFQRQSQQANGPAAPETPPSTTGTSETSAASPDAITALQTRIDSALKAFASLGATTKQNAVTGTLEDEFEDRLALRARIREAINTNALDDSHDIDGNALYHLQFTATLLPGRYKSQFGIASIEIEPPKLLQGDIDWLYYTWLAFVTNRMNQNPGHPRESKIAMSHEMLGPITGLYDVAKMKLELPKTTKKQHPHHLLLAVRPGDKSAFEDSPHVLDKKRKVLNAVYQHFNDLIGEQKLDGCLKKILEASQSKSDKLKLPRACVPDEPEKKVRSKLENTEISKREETEISKREETKRNELIEAVNGTKVSELIEFMRRVVEIAPSIETAVFALGDRSLIEEDVKTAAQRELGEYIRSYSRAKWILKKLKDTCDGPDTRKPKESLGCKAYDPSYILSPSASKDNLPLLPATRNAPLEFCQALFFDANHEADCPTDKLRNDGADAPGRAYPYSADPVLRSQRVSTVTSAANALDLAAAVSAQITNYGASAGGGLGFSRRAAGRADTIERVPQIFGFAGPISDRTKRDDQACEMWHDQACKKRDDQAYEFGWVFGPKLSLDPNGNKLQLRQDARTQQVSADISVPAWWPGAKLKVKTAWKGKFVGGGGVLDNAYAKEDATEKGDPGYDRYDLRVRFRPNIAALDALTVQLARNTTAQGFHQARINMVRPEVIPVCGDAANKSLTIQIYGVDLWRDPKVFFGGQIVQSGSIAVLPDMTGISATIEPALLSKAALDQDNSLVVWTAHGVAEYKVRTILSADCENNAGERPSKTPNASIVRISPTQISICDASVDISVTGHSLSTEKDNYYLGTIRASKLVNK